MWSAYRPVRGVHPIHVLCATGEEEGWGGFRLVLLVRPLIVALRGHFILVFLKLGSSGCGAVSRKHGVKEDCKSCVVGDLHARSGTCMRRRCGATTLEEERRGRKGREGRGGRKETGGGESLMTLRLVVGGNCEVLEGCCGSAVPDTLYTGWVANDGSAHESRLTFFVVSQHRWVPTKARVWT